MQYLLKEFENKGERQIKRRIGTLHMVGRGSQRTVKLRNAYIASVSSGYEKSKGNIIR
jgi:hypothetical protein